MEAPAAELWTEASRELTVLVDGGGIITWVDPRAAGLGLVVGTAFAAYVVPGTEDKAAALCRVGANAIVHAWELALVVNGAPVTMLFEARPYNGCAALLASLVPQDVADAVAEGNRAVHEIVDLNRELARQKIRLEESNKGIRALHAELEQQADRLRSSAEIKSRLVAGVSHEFRTPLQSILGLSQLLLAGADGSLNAEQQTQVTYIRSSAEELSRMINDMLDLSRLDANTAPIRAEVFELRDFLSAMCGTMAPLLPATGPVQLVFDPAPDVAIETDQGKLGQIVRNLISNALKFTERGFVRVTTSIDDDQLRIAVADSGIGIAQADQERIFEEFTQIESPLQRKARGTGLGLPLSAKLARRLGGSIDLHSEPGVGSTFTVIVPRKHA